MASSTIQISQLQFYFQLLSAPGALNAPSISTPLFDDSNNVWYKLFTMKCSLALCHSHYILYHNQLLQISSVCSIVNTNTCTNSTSQVKIYLKSSKKLLHVSVFDHLQGVTISSLKSLLLLTTVGCFYAKSGDVAACYKQTLRWFPRFQVATTCFSCSPPDLNLV